MFVIKHKFIFLSLSGLLVAAAVLSIAIFGFKPGIDFVGGTMWELKSDKPLDKAAWREIFPDATITFSSDGSVSLRLKELSEEEHRAKFNLLQEKFGSLTELRFESIGPAIGREIRTKAVWSFVLVLIGISLYIAFAFRKVSYPVQSWKYGLITLITLFHDAIIPAGLFAILGHYLNAEVNTNFIIAILVVMGFSVHDTIVVFDRIRENLILRRVKGESFEDLVGRSINETLARSINTSLTLVLMLVALYFLGSASLSYFVLVILTGTIVGTYSSICVASTLLTLWQRNGNIFNK